MFGVLRFDIRPPLRHRDGQNADVRTFQMLYYLEKQPFEVTSFCLSVSETDHLTVTVTACLMASATPHIPFTFAATATL